MLDFKNPHCFVHFSNKSFWKISHDKPIWTKSVFTKMVQNLPILNLTFQTIIWFSSFLFLKAINQIFLYIKCPNPWAIDLPKVSSLVQPKISLYKHAAQTTKKIFEKFSNFKSVQISKSWICPYACPLGVCNKNDSKFQGGRGQWTVNQNGTQKFFNTFIGEKRCALLVNLDWIVQTCSTITFSSSYNSIFFR